MFWIARIRSVIPGTQYYYVLLISVISMAYGTMKCCLKMSFLGHVNLGNLTGAPGGRMRGGKSRMRFLFGVHQIFVRPCSSSTVVFIVVECSWAFWMHWTVRIKKVLLLFLMARLVVLRCSKFTFWWKPSSGRVENWWPNAESRRLERTTCRPFLP